MGHMATQARRDGCVVPDGYRSDAGGQEPVAGAMRRGCLKRTAPAPAARTVPYQALSARADAFSWQTCAGPRVRADGRRSDHPKRPFR